MRARTVIALTALAVLGVLLTTGHAEPAAVLVVVYILGLPLRTHCERRAWDRTWTQSGGSIERGGRQ
jgi:hypothetical protein